MHIAEYNVPAYQNDTLRYFVDFFEDGVDYDLTQFSEYKMQVKSRDQSETVLIELVLGTGLAISNGNRMSFDITKAQMDIAPRAYVYDLEGQNEPGDRRTILRGLFEVEADITR